LPPSPPPTSPLFPYTTLFRSRQPPVAPFPGKLALLAHLKRFGSHGRFELRGRNHWSDRQHGKIFAVSRAKLGFGRVRKAAQVQQDRKSTRLNSSHVASSYAVF